MILLTPISSWLFDFQMLYCHLLYCAVLLIVILIILQSIISTLFKYCVIELILYYIYIDLCFIIWVFGPCKERILESF